MNVCFVPKADIHRFSFQKIFLRQNRKDFFTNSVKVGLGSTSDTGGDGRPILGVPGLFWHSESYTRLIAVVCTVLLPIA